MQTKQHNKMSEQDVEEISTVLKNIKTLSLDIGVEQGAQLQQIDYLNQTVDRAGARIRAADKKVKKMI